MAKLCSMKYRLALLLLKISRPGAKDEVIAAAELEYLPGIN